MEGNWRNRGPEPPRRQQAPSRTRNHTSYRRSHTPQAQQQPHTHTHAHPQPQPRQQPQPRRNNSQNGHTGAAQPHAKRSPFDLPSNYMARQPRFTSSQVKGKTFRGKVVDRLRSGSVVTVSVEQSEVGSGETSELVVFVSLKYAEPALNEEVEVVVVDVHGQSIWAVLKPRPPVRPLENLPLLVLDLNGVLLNRRSFHERRKGRRGNSMQLRPFCMEFLQFCFQHFRVGVWSCGKRQNMELELFEAYEDQLVFVWDQENSTNLWPQRSQVAQEKPLFLKELSRVFEAFPQFSAENTVLLDNHLEKFQCNPPNTCCLVPEFNDQQHQTDDLLAPQGAFTSLLRSIAEQYPGVSTSAAISALDSPLFPKSYEQVVKHVDYALFETIEGHLSVDLRRSVAKLFTSSTFMKRHCPDRDERFYMRHRDIPGPRAKPLRKKHLALLHDPKNPHVVCEKSDGTRMLLFLPERTTEGRRECFLVNRTWTFIYGGDIDEEGHCLGSLKDLQGATLLDGEMLTGKNGLRLFLVFDVVWLNGVDVGIELSLLKRMEEFNKVYVPVSSEDAKFAVMPKQFVGMRQVGTLRDNVYKKTYPLVGEVDCDGLVVTPSNTCYYDYTVYKYKPVELLTVDFQVDAHHWRAAKGEQRVRLGATSFTNRSGKPLLVTFAEGVLSRDTTRSISRQINTRQFAIVECNFDRDKGEWRIKRVRTDKRSPNSLDTAWQVMESIAEGLEVSDLERGNLSVAQHYNERQDDRNKGKTPEDGIFMLRKLNNFAKSLLFLEQVHGLSAGEKQDAVKSNDAPLPDVLSRRNAPLRRAAQPKQSEQKGRLSVLDLACGRGGDLLKWSHRDGLSVYVGCDIADVALVEAKRRAKEVKGKAQFHFHQIDMAAPNLPEVIRSSVPSLQGFDVVSVQFAFHYCCSSEETCRNLLSNISSQLREGGKACISTIDSRVLATLLCENESGEYANDVCRVELEDIADLSRDYSKEFGIGYRITVGDAVQECTEFVVPIDRVVELAKDVGLEVTKVQNFGTFITNHIDTNVVGARSLMKRMKLHPLPRPVSVSEWRTIQLYVMLAFEKGTQAKN